MSKPSHRRAVSILQEFRDLLDKKWKREVVCQCPRRPRCVCKRRIVCVARMEDWMETTAPEHTSTNLTRLLDDLYRMVSRTVFPFEATSVLKRQGRCVRVLGALLSLGRGDLIDLFHGAGISDNVVLYNTKLVGHDQIGLLKYLEDNGVSNAMEIIDRFEREISVFCTPSLDMYMELNLENWKEDRRMLPFCKRQRISKKGGTATVYQVAIQKDFVSDPELASALEKSAYKDHEFDEASRVRP
ncbi:hypothetical protein CC78DRAFT_200218 [Lojkania enalia]|uniref:Uncharacterized protein n=1 Tax=Lojkania enalia TaxID=147567 RepID=A0A9P4KBB4_9PLEO|nr:hypothetical protein CC78DRAFT_200218 [Didymosphaeria enalia]